MPNWCENELRVKGEPPELKMFKRKAKRKGTALSFNTLVPVPKELLEVSSPPTIVSEEEYPKAVAEARAETRFHRGLPLTQKLVDEYTARFGADNWYDWRLANWGVKWDTEAVLMDEDDDRLDYQFDTPWGPPLTWLRTVSKQFPGLKFELQYEEPGMEMDGAVTFVNGEGSEEEVRDW